MKETVRRDFLPDKTNVMDDKKTALQEQDHPLKNTDDAFVQVGKNGEPLMPRVADSDRRTESENDKEAPLVYDKP